MVNINKIRKQLNKRLHLIQRCYKWKHLLKKLGDKIVKINVQKLKETINIPSPLAIKTNMMIHGHLVESINQPGQERLFSDLLCEIHKRVSLLEETRENICVGKSLADHSTLADLFMSLLDLAYEYNIDLETLLKDTHNRNIHRPYRARM